MTKSSSTTGDKIYNAFIFLIIVFIGISVMYPLYFILIASISDPIAVNSGKVMFWPMKVTFEGYKKILGYREIWTGYRNTLFYTVLGTAINVSLTITAAYALSRKNLPARGIITALIMFTMIFNGGMIPRFLIIKKLNLPDTIWSMVLPNAVGVWNLMIAKSFIEISIPKELFEAASIDGCSNTKVFFRIVLPLSKAIIAVLLLFYAIGHWNAYFDALLFIRKKQLYPLQLVLREILIQNEVSSMDVVGDAETVAAQQRVSELIKYGAILISSVPPLIIYPFVQKYFTKGVMIGAIKG